MVLQFSILNVITTCDKSRKVLMNNCLMFLYTKLTKRLENSEQLEEQRKVIEELRKSTKHEISELNHETC